MALDLGLARALRAARVLELALAEPEGWSIDLDGLQIPATRQVEDDRVVFRTCIPEIDVHTDTAILCWGGEMQLASAFSAEPGQCFTWELTLPHTVLV